MKLSRLAFALALSSLCAVSAASAQESVWPSRTIQMVVPYTPGTGADILARILGPKLGDRWKIGVVTDNRAGASGNIGTDFVAKAAPDGYTLLCTATSFGTKYRNGYEMANMMAAVMKTTPRSCCSRQAQTHGLSVCRRAAASRVIRTCESPCVRP